MLTCGNTHVHKGYHYPLYSPPPPTKNQGPIQVTTRDLAHDMFCCETPYPTNANSMQTHKCVHTTHNMSTHKFECPAKNLTIHKGNYRESATDVCDYAILYEQIKYHTHASKYVYLNVHT